MMFLHRGPSSNSAAVAGQVANLADVKKFVGEQYEPNLTWTIYLCFPVLIFILGLMFGNH